MKMHMCFNILDLRCFIIQLKVSNKSFIYMLEIQEISNLNILLIFPFVFLDLPHIFPCLSVCFLFVFVFYEMHQLYPSTSGQRVILVEFVQWEIPEDQRMKGE